MTEPVDAAPQSPPAPAPADAAPAPAPAPAVAEGEAVAAPAPAPVPAPAPAVAKTEHMMHKVGLRPVDASRFEGKLKEEASDAITAYNKAVEAAVPEVEKMALYKDFHAAHEAYGKLANFDAKTGKWTAKDGVDKKALSEAQKTFDEARTKLHAAISDEANAAPELKALREARSRVASYTNPVFGKVKSLGFFGAAKDNLNFFGKDVLKTRGLEMGARGVGLGAAAYLGTQAMQDKNADGSEKSGTNRMLELAGALGIGSAAVLAGGLR